MVAEWRSTTVCVCECKQTLVDVDNLQYDCCSKAARVYTVKDTVRHATTYASKLRMLVKRAATPNMLRARKLLLRSYHKQLANIQDTALERELALTDMLSRFYAVEIIICKKLTSDSPLPPGTLRAFR
jgi:hypothetical protein